MTFRRACFAMNLIRARGRDELSAVRRALTMASNWDIEVAGSRSRLVIGSGDEIDSRNLAAFPSAGPSPVSELGKRPSIMVLTS
jgi:hypothetical protein